MAFWFLRDTTVYCIAKERRLGKTNEWMKEKVLDKIALCFHCSSGSILSNIWHNFANCCKSMTGEVRGCFLLRNQRPNPTLTSSSFRFAKFSCVNFFKLTHTHSSHGGCIVWACKRAPRGCTMIWHRQSTRIYVQYIYTYIIYYISIFVNCIYVSNMCTCV